MSKVIASIVLYKHSYAELKATLDSLFATPSIEKVILVDNHSSNWATTFQHPKVVYEKSEGNFGFGYGHNIAIRK
ncbi:glycosyltransferase family 2 protein, partial [Citrobacter freundii]